MMSSNGSGGKNKFVHLISPGTGKRDDWGVKGNEKNEYNMN